MADIKTINVGIIGYGVVGKGTVSALIDNASTILDKTGINIKVKGIADIAIDSVTDEYTRQVEIKTKNAQDLIDNNDIDIIVELIGGYTFAKSFIISALSSKKQVVTANKALLATFGSEIFSLADDNNCDIGFEASVGGAIPIIRVLKEDLAINNVEEIRCIINGTANYILTRMSEEGKEFKDVLKDAQKAGYAEADPTFDIEGVDSAHKIAILSSIAFSTLVSMDDIYTEGISNIKPIDIAIAKEFGYSIKLLAIAKRLEGDDIDVRVHPTMISNENTLASVNGVFNAVAIRSDKTCETLLYGRGAGGVPTGAAVAGDIINIARNLTKDIKVRVPVLGYVNKTEKHVVNIKNISSKYYMRLMVKDAPGVLAKVGLILADNNISVSSALQRGDDSSEAIPLVFMTHAALGKDVFAAISSIDKQDFVVEKTVLIRIDD